MSPESNEIGGALLTLSVIAIVYGALTAMVQADIKRLIACSSVSHMGFITLGLFTLNPEGVVGGMVQMLNHGISTGALFLMAGMIHHRTHTRIIKNLGGLAASMPLLATVFIFFCLSSVGLPGLNGFVGEFLILLGVFGISPKMTAFAASGIVLGAVYLLWMIQRVFFGPLKGGKTTEGSHHSHHDCSIKGGIALRATSLSRQARAPSPRGVNPHGSTPAVGRRAPSVLPRIIEEIHSHHSTDHVAIEKSVESPKASAEEHNKIDLNFRELIVLCPLIFGVFFIGLKPAPIINLVRPPILRILEESKEKLHLEQERKALEKPTSQSEMEEGLE